MASQKNSPIGATPRSLGVPQDAKSNPSNGLVERLRAVRNNHSAFVLQGPAYILKLCGEAADEIEKLREVLKPFAEWFAASEQGLASRVRYEDFRRASAALYQQEGVLSSQRGDGASIETDGPYKLTDERRWLARQLLDSKLSGEEAFGIVAYHPLIKRGENRSANASVRSDASTGASPAAEPSAARSGFYVASRASLPARPEMWCLLRDRGVPINSTWIDEAAPGQTASNRELWTRIEREVAASEALILYVGPDDFPLKGALVECGMALSLGIPVRVVAPDVELEPVSLRPLGSWAMHPLVSFHASIQDALNASPATPIGGLSLGVEGDQVVSVAGLPAHVAEATATDAQHSAGKDK